MENKKLLNFKLKMLLNELDILELNNQYVEEFTNEYKSLFMTEVSKHSDQPVVVSGDGKENKFVIKDEEIFEVTEEEKQKIKEIYREIAKSTHPDKIIDNYLNAIYIESHIFYEKNDLLSLFKLCNKLNISFEVDESDIILLEKIVNIKKQKSIIIESSFLWLWVHAKTKEDKESVILQYINQSKKN